MVDESVDPSQSKHHEDRLRLAKMQHIISDLNAQLASKNAQLAALTARLEEIESARAWNLVRFIWRIRLALFPNGSVQTRLIQKLFGKNQGNRVEQPVSKMKGAGLPGPAGVVASQVPSLTSQGEPVQAQEEAYTENLTVSSKSDGSASHWPLDRFPWPLISVILPVYNHADMLFNAARSVLDSTYPRMELIILDDGSTDAIEPVLEDLLDDPRVRVYRQPNQKLPRALTHAHGLACGELISWTSADNLMTPKALEILAGALLDHPEAVLAYADVSLIDDDGEPMVDGSYRPGNIDRFMPDVLRLYRNDKPLGYEPDNFINACFLYRGEAAKVLEGHYADDLRGLEDYDFWLRLQKFGRLLHVKNESPLYYYRVHQRTMSHELLTQEREAHFARINQFIAYEANRREFADKRWNVLLDSSLSLSGKEDLRRLADHLPINLMGGLDEDDQRLEKIITVSPLEKASPTEVMIHPDGRYWRLEWQSLWNGGHKSIEIWRGTSLSPLALKARQHRPDPGEFPGKRDRMVIGCHLSLAGYPIDLILTRQIISGNPQVLFVFIDVQDEGSIPSGNELVAGLENAVYLGERWLGGPYAIYAHFDAFWLPPVIGEVPVSVYQVELALAYATGRPLVIPAGAPIITAPYQFVYQPLAGLLDFLRKFNRSQIDLEILDRYLESWSPPARLSRLLSYANELIQQRAMPRPDFAISPVPEIFPSKWPAVDFQKELCKVGLAVDSLDIGGLEGVVAQLSHYLPHEGVDVFVLCAGDGGQMADRLRKEGIRIYLAQHNPDKIKAILAAENPAVVNSHHAPLSLLQAARQVGIPVIETIHNTYAWFSSDDWKLEKARSQYFESAIAVSRLVKDYYAHWNTEFAEQRIFVVGNAVNASHIILPERQAARQMAGFVEGDFVFLTLARYDSPKNLIGLLAAFDEMAGRFPQANLLYAGQIFDTAYYEQVKAYREELPSKDRIHLEGFRSDTGVLLAAADAFVLDSIMEGWSLSATEALLAGLPVIHSDCGSGRELVGADGERGILIPNPAGNPLDIDRERFFATIWERNQLNKAALVDAMSDMITNQAEWQARRASIQSYARGTFKVRNQAESYKSCFWQVISKRSNRKE
jgi:glycosyltransferase involved in cell wall biosynthesis